MRENYSKAPITEAIVDIRIQPKPGVSGLDIAAGFYYLHDQGQINPILEPKVQFTFGTSPQLQTASTLTGVRFDITQKYVGQFSEGGFVWSELPPYDTYEAFAEMFMPFWERYVTITKPVAVNRVALRYINTFPITDETMFQPLNEYFNIFPYIPETGTFTRMQGRSFMLQTAFHDAENIADANVQFYIENLQNRSQTAFVLDIDVFRLNSIVPLEIDTIKEDLSVLRRFKNDIFEACITNALRERIQ